MSNEIIRRASIEDLCGQRALALRLYNEALATFIQAREAHGRAVVGLSGELTGIEIDKYGRPHGDFAEHVRQTVDRDMWRGFVVGTPLGSLMDTEERKKFSDGLQKNVVPPADIENVFATMQRLAGDADNMFRRGLVNAFSRLNRDYRSHDGFKIGPRIVLSCVVHYEKNFNWLRTGYRAEDELKDVDRVMHVLDGKAPPEYQQGISAALRTAVYAFGRGGGGGVMECETEYWRLRFFKNGNGHLFPKRLDLVEKANKLIAEHYGNAVGAAPNVAENNAARAKAPPPSAGLDFFPTPPAVIERMMALADIQPHHSVLEPSCGTGELALGAAEIVGKKLTCYEVDFQRAGLARNALGRYGASVVAGDFLEAPVDKLYDRVIMNPPFSHGRDVAHVLEAFSRLKPGGVLVSVVSPAVGYKASRPAELLREFIKRHGARERLPSGSFKASGTMVETEIVVLCQPGAPKAGAETNGFLFAAD